MAEEEKDVSPFLVLKMPLSVKTISKYMKDTGIVSVGKYALYDGPNLFCAVQIRDDNLAIGMLHGGKVQTELPPEFVSALHTGEIDKEYIEQLVKSSEPACFCEPCPNPLCMYRAPGTAFSEEARI